MAKELSIKPLEVTAARGLVTVEQVACKTPLVLTLNRNTYHIPSSTVMAGL
jgi:hypothetical protein